MSDVDLKAWADTYDQAERQVLGGTGRVMRFVASLSGAA